MTIHAESDISYTLIAGGIQIGDGIGPCLENSARLEKLTIPDVHDDKKVISIGPYAFGKSDVYHCDILELIISNNLIKIESRAFESSVIGKIIFPSSLKIVKYESLGYMTVTNLSFENCDAEIFDSSGYQFRWSVITNLILPNGIKELPNGFFWGTTIPSFHIPRSVVKLNSNVFLFTQYLQKISSDSPNFVVHNGILYSSDYRTLIKYPYGETIDILPTVTKISSMGGFNGCSITNFVLKNKIRIFENAVFGYCFSMISCDLSCAVATYIPSSMFYRAEKLEKIIFPKSVIYFGTTIFIFCTKLKSVTLPINLAKIDTGFGIDTIQDIYYCGVNNIITSLNGKPNIHLTKNYP